MTEYTATKNACKLCTPLGAALAFKGMEATVPLLHGSQGCATYIRRYLISHFKEPVDIASSNFSEETAVFGGEANLKLALDNLNRQYEPAAIGIATTCLSETIGEDVPLILRDYLAAANGTRPKTQLIHVSTPSYSGTHMDGFHAAVLAAVEALVIVEQTVPGLRGADCNPHWDTAKTGAHINLFPGMVSPADLRYLKEILADFGLPFVMLPDYSKTLDGSQWAEYQKIPPGGTSLPMIQTMGRAAASLEFGRVLVEQPSAGKRLNDRLGIPCYSLGLPIGAKETDRFFNVLETLTGRATPEKYVEERGRLIDAYVDGHKYVSGVRAVVYGEEDLVIGLASFLREIGVIPILCASGGESGHLKAKMREVIPDVEELGIQVHSGVDFLDIKDLTEKLQPHFLIGSSKGYSLARQLNLPLIRAGFPIHDRFGGARLLHLGYAGTQQLFDRIVNALLEKRQDESEVGYAYM